MSRPTTIALYVFIAIFFGVFLIYPIATTLKDAFITDGGFSIEYVLGIFTDATYLQGFINAFKMAIFSTLGAMLIAMPLAVVADKYLYPAKGILNSLILLPLILPPFVGAIGVKQFLGQQGSLNALLSKFGLVDMDAPVDWLGEGRLFGVVLMNALHLYPIIFLNVTAALANLDPSLDEAAENLGSKAFSRFRRITLPLVMPGIFAGATIVFIWSFTELGVPLIFDFTRVTPVQIFNGIRDMGGNPTPYALVAVTLIFTLILFALSKYAFGRTAYSTSGRASTAAIERELSAPWKAWGITAAFSFVIGIAVLPHIGVVLTAMSTDWYGTVFPASLTFGNFSDALGHDITLPAISNSLKYASLATFADLIIGIAIAYIVVRTRLPGRHVIDSLSMLPLAVPGLVMAFGYLAMTRPGQPFHFLLLGNGNPILILVIAYAVRRLPYVVRSAAAGFQQTNTSLEEAAQNLGAPPLRALYKITLPLISANLIAGGMLAFAFAMLEVSDSLILAQQQGDFPITKAIYGLFRTLGNGEQIAASLGTWAMVFLGVTIVGASVIIGKKLGALFRV